MSKSKTAKLPAFVRSWASRQGVAPGEIHGELCCAGGEGDPDWAKASESLLYAEKYNNVDEIILRHRQSGRFVRLYRNSLPYGIDYGMAEEDEEIVEVFPAQALVTTYLIADDAKEGRALPARLALVRDLLAAAREELQATGPLGMWMTAHLDAAANLLPSDLPT